MIKHDIKGQEKTFIVTSRPFLNAQKEVIGIVESFQDIPERKLAEDAKVEFSHGICPDCAQKLYPDLYNETIKNN